MKNFYRPVKTETFKYITIVWVPQVESVKLMVQEHYDTIEYKDTIFFINCLYSNDGLWLNKVYFPQERKIYYNLEHPENIDSDTSANLFIVLNAMNDLGITEVWSMEPGSKFYEDNFNTKYMPMRFTTLLRPYSSNIIKTVDCGLVGAIDSESTPYRLEFMHEYNSRYDIDFSLKILNGETINNFSDELCMCKYVLDMPRINGLKQNQVRLFEHICLGHNILSKHNDINLFNGLITEWYTIDDVNDLVHSGVAVDGRNSYKELTYRDEDYNAYKENLIGLYE